MYLGAVRDASVQDDFCAERVRERDKAWPFIPRKTRPQRVHLHDTRATFVTVSLANGKSEAWVQDRTGHKSSAMIAKYRRAVRMAAEVGMGPSGVGGVCGRGGGGGGFALIVEPANARSGQ